VANIRLVEGRPGPTTADHIRRWHHRISAAWGKFPKLDEVVIETWTDALGDLPPDLVEHVVTEFIKGEDERPPSVGKIRAEAERLCLRRRQAEEDRRWKLELKEEFPELTEEQRKENIRKFREIVAGVYKKP
jgi:hypothetical protein